MTNDDLPARIQDAHDSVEPSASFRAAVTAQLEAHARATRRRRWWLPYAIAAAVAAIAIVITTSTIGNRQQSATPNTPTTSGAASTAGSAIGSAEILGAWTLDNVVDGEETVSATEYPAVLELTADTFRFTTKCTMANGPYGLDDRTITFRGATAGSGCIPSQEPAVAKLQNILDQQLFEGPALVTVDDAQGTLTLDIHHNLLTFTRTAEPVKIPQNLSPLSNDAGQPAPTTSQPSNQRSDAPSSP